MDILNRSWKPEDKTRLSTLLTEGDNVLTEIADRRESLNDLLKTISEELDIPVKSLRMAIKAYHKRDVDENRKTIDDVEQILQVAGKG